MLETRDRTAAAARVTAGTASGKLRGRDSRSMSPLLKPTRILQIVENLDNQAVETWLVRVLRAAAPAYPNVHWTFFCVEGREGRMDNEVRELGADIIHSRFEIGDKRRFLLGLRSVMKQESPDILHCHHDIMSAAYLAASAGLPIRKRIVHLHNTSLSLPTPNRLKADLLRGPMRQVCLRMADQIVGISQDALASLVGQRTPLPNRQSVVHYAVDTDRFGKPAVDPKELRRTLGLLPSATVLLFVGRMIEYKNPQFVVEILERLVKDDAQTFAVFAGVGDQEQQVRELAQRKSLHDRVRLLGFRDDVPALMHAADLLLWPSLEDPKEGLGLGIIEAQAAGLPILTSRAVPEEAIVVSELVQVLPLSAGTNAWAEAARAMLQRTHPSLSESQRRVAASSFSLAQGVTNMMALYDL